MSLDPKESLDASNLLGVFARLSQAWLAAGADLWGRSAEVGSRRMADGLTGMMSTGSDAQQPRRGLDALLRRYRGLLGELALLGPLAAQRFARELATPRGKRLLFSASGHDWAGLGGKAAAAVAVADAEDNWTQHPDTESMPSLSALDLSGQPAGVTDDEATPYPVQLFITTEVQDAVLDALGDAGVREADVGDFFAAVKRYLEERKHGDQGEISLLDLEKEIADTVKRVRDRFAGAGDADRALVRASKDQAILDKAMHDLLVDLKGTLPARYESDDGHDPNQQLVEHLKLKLDYGVLQRNATRKLLQRLKEEADEVRLETKQIEQRLDQIREALGKRAPAIDQVPAFMEGLKQLLGERTVGSLARPESLGQLGTAREVSDKMRRQLESAFEGSGIPLTGALSIVCEGRDWTVYDHAADRMFDIARVEGIALGRGGSEVRARLDVFGEEEGRCYRYPGAKTITDRPLLLPLRVHRASQGLAVFPVRKDRVQDYLDTLPDRPFRAWDIGSRRGAAVILVVDYKETDIGAYQELGIGCLVTPKSDPLAVGVYLLALPVTSQVSEDVGCRIWGYPKTHEPGLNISYTEDEVTCKLHTTGSERNRSPIFSLTLPRGGSDSSADIPIYTYTQKRGLYHRTVFMRSGEGEHVAPGGRAVRMELTSGGKHDVLKALDTFGITTQAVPMLTAWTERMWGEAQAPVALDLFDQTDAARPGAPTSGEGEVIAQAHRRL